MYVEESHLKQLFRDYIRTSVVMNDHIIDVLFHSFCGILFPIRIVYGGEYIRCRVCYFMIQESGSGKGQSMKALKYLLWKLLPRYKVFMLNTTTDAALIGSPDINEKAEKKQSRLLTKKDVLLWDEGSLLLKSTPNAENLQDIVQSATDEPGKIGKALKDGEIEGSTHTTIIAGSYFEDNIKYQVLRKGFFQRMFLTYKEFTDAERLEIQKLLGNLECSTSYIERKKLETAILKELHEVYHYQYGTPWGAYKLINHPEDVKKYFSDECVKFYKKDIMYQYLDRRQRTLETFWNRARMMALKIAAQNAYLHHRDYTTTEDMEYSFNLLKKYHITGIKELLNNLSDKKEEYVKIDKQSEKELVLQYIGTLNQEKGKEILTKDLIEFVQKIKDKREAGNGKLYLGRNKVLEIVNELIEEGRIEATLQGNAKLLKVKSQIK